ncbi:MAG: GNAT family N-acetyltransferase [Rhodothalassiaceae bacterium]
MSAEPQAPRLDTELDPDLTTDRLVLRLPEPSDAPALLAALNDWQVAATLARLPHPYELAHARSWIDGRESDPLPHWLITAARDGGVLGGIGLKDEVGGRLEVGYWIARAQWNKGYAGEALDAVLAHCFGPLALDEVWSGHFADNAASRRVLLRSGFQPAGSEPTFCVARGCTLDTLLLRITPKSWVRWRPER